MNLPALLRLSRLVAVAGLLVAVAAPATGQPAWIPTDLGTLGGSRSRAAAINDAGQIVGSSQTASGYYHAFLWTAAGGMVDLDAPGGVDSGALGINDTGQVVGYRLTANWDTHAFLWTAAAGMVDLGTLGGTFSAAYGINDAGQVVGSSTTASGDTHAFLWTAAGGMVDLVGGTSSFAYGINDAGQVVGSSTTASGDTHAFLWTTAAGMVDLGTLGGGYIVAAGINTAGQVVGSSTTASGRAHAFLWTAASGMVDLGTLSVSSGAHAINDAGQVVGDNGDDGVYFSYHAFLWTAAAGMVDLGTLGGDYSSASGINDAGQVVGHSWTLAGLPESDHATLWSPPDLMPPFGAFDTPIAGASLSGSIAVTGWALDDAWIDRVEIWRDLVPGETTVPYAGSGPGNGKVFIAQPLFISGSRPDVEAAYPTTPFRSRSGWGYLLLTQGLWQQGNGPFTLYAFAYDAAGHSTPLGTKTVTADNAHAVKPFGALDTPTYGATATTSFWNYGWALTPLPNSEDGRTCTIANGNILMGIDSGPPVPVSYGDLRTDIAGAFPGFSNGNNAGGASYIDLLSLANGTHQIGWLVTDNCGRQDGIGSRFFTVAR